MTKPLQEIKQRYEHVSINHNGIRVDIVIDYITMKVAIVDSERNNKDRVFVNRSLSYEYSWYNILEAIKEAMKVWFDKLRVRQEENENEKIIFTINGKIGVWCNPSCDHTELKIQGAKQ